PELRQLLTKYQGYEKNDLFPPGHFYSPVFDVEELKLRQDKIWTGVDKKEVAGIDLNDEGQVALATSFEKYYAEMPFDKGLPDLRYAFVNDFYSYTDGITLYSMMRHFQPKRIVEVGSGHSSALMLDTKEHFKMDTELVFIEPFPERLNSLLRQNDREQCRVVVSPVQEVDPAFFAGLGKNDILFIDSSHVVKTGSDLHYLIFKVIPALNPGVLIHFHDVFYPFEYPKNWVFMGRNWNEDYFLRAFLMYNNAFRIRFFAHFLHAHYNHVFANMPLCYKNIGGNIWLEKLA
ncbi:MAG: class I SAM-dependent methyltransferase, partial [Bacteroidota bacterium]